MPTYADLSSLDPKYSTKKNAIVSRNILSQNIPRKKNQNALIPSEHPPVRDCSRAEPCAPASKTSGAMSLFKYYMYGHTYRKIVYEHV